MEINDLMDNCGHRTRLSTLFFWHLTQAKVGAKGYRGGLESGKGHISLRRPKRGGSSIPLVAGCEGVCAQLIGATFSG